MKNESIMQALSLRGRLLAPVLAAMVLAGCASAPALDPASLPSVPARFKAADAGQGLPTAQAGAAWWKAFGDPALDGLIERANQRNTSIQVAAARVAQARAFLRATDAQRAPQVGLNAGAARQTQPGVSPHPDTLVSLGVGASYEADLFGRLALDVNAASLDAQSREALLASTRLVVQADVAQTYFALRALDVERGLVSETLAAHRDTQRLTETRFQAGDVAELDVARVRAEVAETESDLLTLDRRRAELEHALAVLVGEAASDFTLEAGEWSTALPIVPAGLPSQVLQRRPDVIAAQASMRAALARVGVAQAAWFPSITLTAAGGYASPEIGDLLRASSRSWVLEALLSLPLFDGGRREAGVASAKAELEAALADYRGGVLVAFKEVEDQLSGLALLSEQARAQTRAVDAARRATALSDSRYRNGLVSQLELLDARRSELRNRRQALQVRAAQAQSTVALIRALGGGWNDASAGLLPTAGGAPSPAPAGE